MKYGIDMTGMDKTLSHELYLYFTAVTLASAIVLSLLIEYCGRRLLLCFLWQAIMLAGLIWNKVQDTCDSK